MRLPQHTATGGIDGFSAEKACVFGMEAYTICGGPKLCIPTACVTSLERRKGSPYANRLTSFNPMTALIDAVPLERPDCAPALDDPDAGTWFLALAKSNRHYDFCRMAGERGIEFYLPLAERIRQTPDGKRRMTSYPLLGAYCFFRGTIYTPADALGTQMLRQVIQVKDQPKIRRDLANLEMCLCRPGGRRMEYSEVTVTGKRVRVSSGPYEGCYGTVAGCRGNSDLIQIQVEGVMGGAVLEISAGKLEPAD